jgi:hypothetical protein
VGEFAVKRFIWSIVVVASFAWAVPAMAATSPSAQRTPGAVRSDIAEAQVCAPGGVTEPTVSPTVAKAVYKSYGVSKKQQSRYQLDTLVPYQLGGDTTATNLWPMSSKSMAAKTSATRDAVAQVCATAVPLTGAQAWFTPSGWRSAASQAKAAGAQKAANDAAQAAAVKAENDRLFFEAIKAEQDRKFFESVAAAQAAEAARQQQQSSACSNGSYVNSAGNTVCSPSSNSSGATAQCRDGSYSYSQSRSGTCSGHGGVASWL